jgi:hypothetical protein
MSINIGIFTFDGPYKTATTLKDKSGIYAILSLNGVKINIIDIGESSMVKTRIEGHFKDSSLYKQYKGFLMVAVCYTPNIQQAGRRLIQKELRLLLKPVCG